MPGYFTAKITIGKSIVCRCIGGFIIYTADFTCPKHQTCIFFYKVDFVHHIKCIKVRFIESNISILSLIYLPELSQSHLLVF